MHDSEYINPLHTDSIDDPVRRLKHLANIGSIELKYGPAGFGKLADLLSSPGDTVYEP